MTLMVNHLFGSQKKPRDATADIIYQRRSKFGLKYVNTEKRMKNLINLLHTIEITPIMHNLLIRSKKL